jgi:hypothetical protein
MPRSFTWKQLLRTGIVLAVVGLVAGQYLVWLVFLIGGQEAINNDVLQWTQTLLGQVALQLGLALIAFLLVTKALGTLRISGVAAGSSAPRDGDEPAPRVLVRLFWIGVAVVVLGLVLQVSLAAWQGDLSGATDVGRGLARDILWVVGAPLQAVAVPLGTMLVAGSLVARSVTANRGVVEGESRAASAERF